MTFGALSIGSVLLATAALVACWRSPALIPVGGALVLNCVFSQLAQWLQFHFEAITLDERISILVLVEALLASMAFLARMTGATRLMILVVAVATLSVCGDLAVLMIGSPTLDQRHSWNFLTNVCYTAECLLILSAGLLERGRQSRRDRRPHHARLLVARDDYRGADH